jgi:cytochrome c
MDRLLTRRGHRRRLCLIAAGAWLCALPAAAADPGAGKGVFAAQCSTCHSATRNGPTIIGPPLFGVIGRKAGSFPGYAYSPAMKGAGFVWSDDRLHAYLPAPRAMLPGIKMTYAGLKNPAQLDDVIAYLKTQK